MKHASGGEGDTSEPARILPALVGTDVRVEWAGLIRTKAFGLLDKGRGSGLKFWSEHLADVPALYEQIEAELTAQLDADYWIVHRHQFDWFWLDRSVERVANGGRALL